MDASTLVTIAPPATPAAAPKIKENFSNFLLTANTNIRPHTPQDAQMFGDYLYRVLPLFFAPDVMSKCIRVKSGTRVTAYTVSQWGVELGTDKFGQRVHFHAFLKFTHTGSMQLSIPKIQEEFLALWNAPGNPKLLRSLAVHIRWLPAQEELTKRYISKQGRSE